MTKHIKVKSLLEKKNVEHSEKVKQKDLGRFPYQSAYMISPPLTGGVTFYILTLHCSVLFSLPSKIV